jgi:glutamate racemase
VELVEQGLEHSTEAEMAVRKVVEPLLVEGVDKIVLGCTHYPFLLEALERAAEGYRVTFVDPSPAVARRVKQLLEADDLLCEVGHSPQYQFVTFADEAYRDRLEQKAADTMEPISRVI